MRHTTGGRCHQHRSSASRNGSADATASRAAASDPFTSGTVGLRDLPAQAAGDPFHGSALKMSGVTTVCTGPGCAANTTARDGLCASCHSNGNAPGPDTPGYQDLIHDGMALTACTHGGCGRPTRSRTGVCIKHRGVHGPSSTDRADGLPQRSAAAERDILNDREPRLIDLIGSGPQLGLAARGSDQHRRDIRTRDVKAWCIGGSDDDPCPNTTKSTTGRCGGHRPPAYGSICIGITTGGQRCRRSVWGRPTCDQHRDGDTVLTTDTHLCTAIAHSGKRCTKTAADGTVTCYLHAHWSDPDADAAGHLAGTSQANPDHDGRVTGGIGRWKTRQASAKAPQSFPRDRRKASGAQRARTAPKAPKAGFRSYAHANDAVVGPAAAKENLPAVEHLRGRKIVFVDMDGTVYDSWHCCSKKDNSLVGNDECRHIRTDTVEAIKQTIADNTGPDGIPPVPVALTWRAGCETVTREWLGHLAAETGLEITDVFLPGSSQDIAGLAMPRNKGGGVDHQANRTQWGGGQVAFKAREIESLLDVLGIVPVGHFEDNADVLKMSEGKGTGHIHHVPRLVTIEKHEWDAGYLGAPKPKYGSGSWGGGRSNCEVCNNPFDGVNVRKSDADRWRCTDCVASVGTWAEEQKAKRASRKAAAKDNGIGKARKIVPPADPFTPVPDDDYSAGNHCTSCGTPVGGHPGQWAVCDDCDYATTGADGAEIVEGSDLWLDTGGEMEEVTVMMADDGTDSVAVKRRSDGEMLFVDAEDLHSTPF
ncbi:hypothetical protein DVS28_b0273 (plasmid) [Euzebya pacifica]|uniref:Uncharacterized protein n=1 Tax=Euzebya pacifica TaxID=1608957 RepID=A0A346Y6E6_9ACTN|nr:hypothetical protein [Euzebya pacifica]AXV10043.1 hypothetical protein DVS28_b0273 [Euzebya pacifica]